MAQLDHRSRLIAFMQKYQPDKVGNADAILQKYAGKETELFAQLVARYGPEPGAETVRDRLVRFYQKYQPDKVGNIDKILEAYAGRTDELFAQLVGKYGPEPPGPAAVPASTPATSSAAPAAATAPPSTSDHRSRLIAFMQKYQPDKVGNADAILQKYAGKETELFAQLVSRYGPEPASASNGTTVAAPIGAAPAGNDCSAVRERLVRFYQKYQPDKMGNVDKILEAYAGRTDELFAQLVGKYGPEPVVQPAATVGAPPSASPTAASVDYRSRLIAFMQKYQPDKVGNADAILQKYSGKESELFAQLVSRYGPEPPAPSGSLPASTVSSSAPTSTDTPRDRLVRFYQKYQPDKMGNIDKILEAYAGKMDELFKQLVGKYGPEPPGSAAPAAAAATDYRSRLVTFMQKYQPDKVGNADAILQKYAGKESELFAQLVARYGPEPAAATGAASVSVVDTPRDRLVRFYQKYQPDKMGNIDKILEAYAGKMDELFAQLVTKYGPEPPIPAANVAPGQVTRQPRDRLIAFMQKYQPDKIGNVDAILQKYAGKEDELFAQLVTKYGPEPPMPTDQGAAAGAPAGPRARLLAFMQKYQPDKIGNVDSILQKFAGKEDELFAQLVAKYGPEPAAAPPPSTAGNTVSSPDPRTRLLAFMQKYQPDKIGNVDAILQKYAGKVDELFVQLVAKFGPEPAVAAPGGNAGTVVPLATQQAAAASLPPDAFATPFSVLLPQLDPFSILASMSLEELRAKLPEVFKECKETATKAASPTTTTPSAVVVSSVKDAATGVTTAAAPLTADATRAEDVAWLLTDRSRAPPPPASTAAAPQAVANREEQPSAAVAVAAAPQDPRSRLVAFMQKYQPEKLGNVDAILQKYAGKEDELFAQLVSKYGPEPATTAPLPAGGASPTPSRAASAPADYRPRLVAFMQKYQPDKVGNVDAILQKYVGKESELFAQLVSRYGPEPPPPPPTSQAATADSPRDRLVRFYQKYQPDKMGNIDKILEAYAGKIDELFAQLVGKYGPEPPGPAAPTAATDYRSRLVAFMQKYQPDKVGNADAILQKYAGKESELFAQLVSRYGPEPAAATGGGTAVVDTPRDRLVRFYQKYQPDKMGNIDKILEAYAGKIDELFAQLVGKYGPEPPGPATPAASASSSSVAASAPATDYRSRLVTFMQKYQPDKVGNADAILQKYAGKESELFAQLVARYGPEPAAATGAANISVVGTPRDRLVRFYQKYQPDKMGNIDKILEAYAGKLDELFAQLVGKYGPEPPGPVAPAASTSSSSVAASGPAADYRSRLIAFMQKYQPDKVGNADAILQKYVGKETELFAQLVSRYGPEPPTSSGPPPSLAVVVDTPRDRLVRFYQKYQPDKMGNIEKILEAYAGKIDELFKQLVGKYGAEPPGPAQAAGAVTDFRSRLVSFMQKYQPDKVSNVDAILQKYVGKESELMAQLVSRYGPEPLAAPNSTPATATTPVAVAERPAVPVLVRDLALEDRGRYLAVLAELCHTNGVTPLQLVTQLLGGSSAAVEAHVRRSLQTPGGRSVLSDPSVESRLIRLLGKHDPAALRRLPELTEAATTDAAFLEVMVAHYGPEPPATLDTVRPIVHLVQRPLYTCADLNNANLMEEAADGAASKSLGAALDGPEEAGSLPPLPDSFTTPLELTESDSLLKDAEAAQPGQCEDDESKTYPSEKERWLRLRFTPFVATEAEISNSMSRFANGAPGSPSSSSRQRAFTEFVRGGDGDEDDGDEDDSASPRAGAAAGVGSPKAAGSNSSQPGLGSPRSRGGADGDHGDGTTATKLVCTADVKGRETGLMCLGCSLLVVKAFDALWTPVGPRHRQLLQAQAMKEGWLDKLSGGRLGNKWQRRFVRMNDRGLHYYETDKPNEKAKGHKQFTPKTQVIAAVDGSRHPKCADTRFFYFCVTVNSSNEEFLLRAETQASKDDWMSFIRESIERLKITMVGNDPNPGRWRARLDSVRQESRKTYEEAKRQSIRQARLQAKRDALAARLRVAQDENQFLDLKFQDALVHQEQLKALIASAQLKAIASQNDAEKAEDAAKQTIVALKRQHDDVLDAKVRAELQANEIKQLIHDKQLVLAEREAQLKASEEKHQSVFNKWRRIEGRSPSNSKQRSQHGEGLAYRPPGSAPPSTTVSVGQR